MPSIFVRPIDSNELESRFSTEDRLQYFEESKYSLDDVKPFLAMLPKKEADLILMYYILRKDQKEIAKILNLSQGGVSHRIARARERLKFLISIPKFTKTQLFSELKDVIEEEIDLIIMWELYRTTCQSQVAELVGMTQSRVRHRYMKSLKILEERNTLFQESQVKLKELQASYPSCVEIAHLESFCTRHANIGIYFKAFDQISQNFNILHEISLPKWAHKNRDYRDIRIPKRKAKRH